VTASRDRIMVVNAEALQIQGRPRGGIVQALAGAESVLIKASATNLNWFPGQLGVLDGSTQRSRCAPATKSFLTSSSVVGIGACILALEVQREAMAQPHAVADDLDGVVAPLVQRRRRAVHERGRPHSHATEHPAPST
jgi:hypothetical protein